MSQTAIDFGANESARHVTAAILDVVREVVGAVSLKQVAYDLDVSPSTLSDSLNGREHRPFRLEWLPVVMARASEMQRAALLSALANPHGLEVSRRKVLTPEERLSRLEELVRLELGQVGESLLKKANR